MLKPVRLLVKVPVPVPFTVLVLRLAVGLGEVLQHTPLAVIVAPPSELTVPPLMAVVRVIPETAVVLTLGTTKGEVVVNRISLP